MSRKSTTSSRTSVRGVGWKRAMSIDTDKFEVISGAIMGSLTASPISYTELVNRVDAKVDSFEGSLRWYTMSCLRELEVQGKVQKHQRPVRYSRGSEKKVIE